MRMVKVDDQFYKARRITKWAAVFEEFIAMDANVVELEGIMNEYDGVPAHVAANINASARRFGYRVRAFSRGGRIYLTKFVD